ncbi:7692_t:CDS:2 [Paraglomus brasilianum]|uniref:7692_t:CDS:1 n=1 Tax=Paraglomus brasilianum TaxID=144538 RepID=A0A9N8WKH7_9GLOM|nr:7692_t:CDS:2 [Paraglomus brasilianum]
MTDATDTQAKQKRLNQDDFRKLLQTPRPGDATSKIGSLGTASNRQRLIPPQTPRVGGNTSSTVTKAETLISKPRKSRFIKPTPTSPPHNQYRDRAAERRENANPDYQDTEQILKALNQTETLASKTVYEQSKYLGGDTEHTHLVKGLDFALLTKVRNELSKEGQEDEDEDTTRELERLKEETQEVPRIMSKLANNIYQHVTETKKPPPKVNELFIAGRMAYVFELADNDGNYNDPFAIPTTIIRSKADIADLAEVDKSTNDIVIEKISQVMAYARSGDQVRMVKAAAIDDDEDIFAEAGRDYSVTIEEKDKETQEEKEETAGETAWFLFPAAAGAANVGTDDTDNINKEDENNNTMRETDTKKKYFFHQADSSMDTENNSDTNSTSLHTLIQSATASDTHDGSTYFSSLSASTSSDPQTSKTSSSSHSPSIRKRLISQDSYDVDYSIFGFGMGGVARENAYDSGQSDSDSDETHTIRDQGVAKNKKAQLVRWDFETEEEWQEYKIVLHLKLCEPQDKVTAMPKSAFQFGVKTSDGRQTRRSRRELTDKQKLDRDFQKINRIMEEKYGEGMDEGLPKKKQKK